MFVLQTSVACGLLVVHVAYRHYTWPNSGMHVVLAGYMCMAAGRACCNYSFGLSFILDRYFLRVCKCVIYLLALVTFLCLWLNSEGRSSNKLNDNAVTANGYVQQQSKAIDSDCTILLPIQ